jgi:putative endopeptidase
VFLAPLALGLADDRKDGIDPKNFDKNVRVQDDLFRHVNGAWLKTAEIPADRPADGAFHALRDKAEADVREIVEAAAKKADKEPGSEVQKIGDLYASFIDEDRVEKLGLKPIESDLAKIDTAADKSDVLRLVGNLQRNGSQGAFRVRVEPDAKQSDRYIIYLSQGGIGLPDESFYREAKFEPVRKAYVAHVAKMFALANRPSPEAAAGRVMELETLLAKSHWDNVKSRDETRTYNKFNLGGLVELTPNLDWAAFVEGFQPPHVDEVIVRQPDYFTALAKAVEDAPLASWKDWIAWRLLDAHAEFLSKAFVEEDFNFSGRVLSGATEIRPRWKRGVEAVDRGLGEAVGKLYVEKHYPAVAKARMTELVNNLIEAYREDIEKLEWMGPETRQKALDKLSKFSPMIGHPDKWRDYSKLEIKADDLVGNVQRARRFELERQLNKLGQPVDRGEWTMTPQTVNAYYNPGRNVIVFPASILQPPFFDPEADDAVNYGGIGAVIGHEIGHGFDDQGSKYDGDGNMKDWWTEADRTEFEKRAKKLIDQYGAFEPAQLPGQKVNGALTIGENIGDLGGLTIAFKAYQRSLKGAKAPVIDGRTGEQRFFTGWAQVWRIKMRDQELTRRLAVDPHSPGEFRCNGVVRNLPEFYEAFGVKEGDKLWLPADQRVRIW